MFHWICPECGQEIAPGVKECPVCDPQASCGALQLRTALWRPSCRPARGCARRIADLAIPDVAIPERTPEVVRRRSSCKPKSYTLQMGCKSVKRSSEPGTGHRAEDSGAREFCSPKLFWRRRKSFFRRRRRSCPSPVANRRSPRRKHSPTAWPIWRSVCTAHACRTARRGLSKIPLFPARDRADAQDSGRDSRAAAAGRSSGDAIAGGAAASFDRRAASDAPGIQAAAGLAWDASSRRIQQAGGSPGSRAESGSTSPAAGSLGCARTGEIAELLRSRGPSDGARQQSEANPVTTTNEPRITLPGPALPRELLSLQAAGLVPIGVARRRADRRAVTCGRPDSR